MNTCTCKYLDYEGLKYTFESLDKNIKEICGKHTDPQKVYEEISRNLVSLTEGFKNIMTPKEEKENEEPEKDN